MEQNNMTAVEWLYERLERMIPRTALYNMDKEGYLEAAKQMEKEQIMKSFKSARIPYKYDADLTLNGFEDAEHYYNETYGK